MMQIMVLGNLGKDPKELADTDSGTRRCSFSVAARINREESQWFDVLCYGGTADAVMNYKKKGDQVVITGRLQPWWREDGSLGLSIRATEVGFCRGGEKGEGGGEKPKVDDPFS